MEHHLKIVFINICVFPENIFLERNNVLQKYYKAKNYKGINKNTFKSDTQTIKDHSRLNGMQFLIVTWKTFCI